MKTWNISKSAAGLCVLLAVTGVVAQTGPPGRGMGRGPGGGGCPVGQCPLLVQAAATTAAVPLQDAEQQSLLKMRDEEKLAHDVYVALGEKWKLPMFANISQAEERHLSVVEQLIKNYSVATPSDKAETEFWDGEYAALYEQLVATGTKSLADAMQVGIEIEELDIRDLREQLQSIQHADIRAIYTRLEQASQRHLHTFVRGAEWMGVTPVAKHLDQAAFDSILQTPTQPGPGRGMGPGRQGRGYGPGGGRGRGLGPGPAAFNGDPAACLRAVSVQ